MLGGLQSKQHWLWLQRMLVRALPLHAQSHLGSGFTLLQEPFGGNKSRGNLVTPTTFIAWFAAVCLVLVWYGRQGLAHDGQMLHLLSPGISLSSLSFLPRSLSLDSTRLMCTPKGTADDKIASKADTSNNSETDVSQLRNQWFPQQGDFHSVSPTISLTDPPAPHY